MPLLEEEEEDLTSLSNTQIVCFCRELASTKMEQRSLLVKALAVIDTLVLLRLARSIACTARFAKIDKEKPLESSDGTYILLGSTMAY